MHELSLATLLVNYVSEDARQRGISRVTQVDVEIGELSGILDHAFQQAFPIAAEGTVLQQAKLVIISVEAEARCNQCGARYHPLKSGWRCPLCGSAGASLEKGREFNIVSYTGEAS